MVTALDGGKGLLDALTEHGSLTSVNTALGVKQKMLQESLAGLEQKVDFKNKLEMKITLLAAEKNSLEKYVETAPIAKEQFEKFESMRVEASGYLSQITEQANLKLQEKLGLEKIINFLLDQTKDLNPKAKQVIELNARIAELQEQKKRCEDEWLTFLGFVALICEQPLEGLEKFSEVLPLLLKGVKKGEYKAITVRNHTVKMLTGTEFTLPMCYACVNKSVRIEPPKPKKIPVIPFSISVVEDSGSSKDPGVGAS